MRLSRTVLRPARPTAPPRLRVRLNSPDAFFSRSGASVPSEMLVIGTIANIMPKPRSTCGRNSCQNSQSLVSQVICQLLSATTAKPNASISRASIRVISRPTSGAVRNMVAPEMNRVWPIISALKPRIWPR